MVHRHQAERPERLGPGPEPGADDDRIGLEQVAIDQLDRCDAPMVIRNDASHLSVDHGHAGRPERVDLRVVSVDTVVEHQGETVGQLAEEARRVQPHRVRDDLDDASVADLEPVAERTMDDVTAPVLGQTVDVGEFVDQTGGGEDPPGDHRGAAHQFDPEAVVIGAGHVHHAAVQDFASVAADLVATDGRQLRRGDPLVSQVAVHVGGRGVPRIAGIDDDDRPALPPELERSGQTGGRSADDGDVAVALDGAVLVFAHRA